MKRAIVVSAAAGIGAGLAAWRLRARAAARRAEPERWLTVTVNCPPERLEQGELPEPLIRLGDHIELATAPAPGGKGTELSARLRDDTGTGSLGRLSGADPRQQVRRALREAKSLVETGEVMRAEEPPTTRPTPGGKLVEMATRRAGGEGRL